MFPNPRSTCRNTVITILHTYILSLYGQSSYRPNSIQIINDSDGTALVTGAGGYAVTWPRCALVTWYIYAMLRRRRNFDRSVTWHCANVFHQHRRPSWRPSRPVMLFNQAIQTNSAWPSLHGWEKWVLATVTASYATAACAPTWWGYVHIDTRVHR